MSAQEPGPSPEPDDDAPRAAAPREPAASEAATSVRVSILPSRGGGGPAGGDRGAPEPLTFGVPWPRGVLRDERALVARSEAGEPRALGARALERWADGSVRWALVDVQVDPALDRALVLEALAGDADAPGAAPPPSAGGSSAIDVREEREGGDGGALAAILLDAGAMRARLHASGALDLELPGEPPALASAARRSVRGALVIEPADGPPLRLARGRLAIAERGPLRAALDLTADAIDERGARVLACFARVEVFAGLPVVRVAWTVRNPRRAAHPGGVWELGDPGSRLLRSVRLRLEVAPPHAAPPPGAALRASLALDDPFAARALPFELHQASSGGEHWRSEAHMDASGQVRLPFRGWRGSAGEERLEGLRATPALALDVGDGAALGCTMERFWERFPKAVRARAGALDLDLLPLGESLHELQGGEQTTEVVTLALGASADVERALEVARAPSFAIAPPAWHERAEALPFFTAPREPLAAASAADHAADPAADRAADRAPPSPGEDRAADPGAPEPPSLDALRLAALDAAQGFAAKREVVDEYGWRHFGDLWADHEAAYHRTPEDAARGPRVSHYNNQYDPVLGLSAAFLRTGDPRWWELARDLAAHVIDVDVYRTDEDKAAYNHGLFWHTAHYVDAGRSTHRTYPRDDPRAGSGGPSNEHLYSSGLLLYHLLTGCPRARATVLELAEWTIAMDDGRRTPFRWLAGGPSGAASKTTTLDYHGPGRGAGNAVRALLDAHRLAGESRYLDKAEELTRRVIHPRDDPEAKDLLHAELRWSYTVFLETLGRLLEHLRERGALDGLYAYARESLLHYARFVAEHEVPYLARPERLEYPTETWAAQEVRKAEVLALARLHSEDAAERARFLDRARSFARDARARLGAMPTRTCTRPVVILLSTGFVHAYAEAHPEARRPPPTTPLGDPGQPARFEPQRARALRRAKAIVAVGGALALAAAAALLAHLLRS